MQEFERRDPIIKATQYTQARPWNFVDIHRNVKGARPGDWIVDIDPENEEETLILMSDSEFKEKFKPMGSTGLK